MIMTSGLIKPSEQFNQEIAPALDDYIKNPLSERLANSLARAIDHQLAWTFEYYNAIDPSRLYGAKNEKALRVTLSSDCEELRMMNDLSDAAHHRFLTRKNDPPRIVEASTSAYYVEAGALYVRKYNRPFLPSATTATDFWRRWKD
jgi:hypothetical protein